jgi:hypothetical protein
MSVPRSRGILGMADGALVSYGKSMFPAHRVALSQLPKSLPFHTLEDCLGARLQELDRLVISPREDRFRHQ